MRASTFAMVSTALFLGTLLLKGQCLSAETDQGRMVRLAELEIDPAHLELYKAALREKIATSIRTEPGVLTLYAVFVKDHPTQIGYSRCMRTLPLMKRISNRHILKCTKPYCPNGEVLEAH